MELKKNEKYELEPKRPMFFGIGLILALAFVIAAFEWKSEIDPIIGCYFGPEDILITPIVPVTEQKKPEPPKPKVERKPVAVVETKVEMYEDVKKEVIDNEPTDSNPPIIEVPVIDIVEPVDEPFLIVEEMPSFVGGYDELYRFIGNNIKYPSRARALGVQGKVYVKFIVEKDGSLSNIEILRGIGAGCDIEASRVMALVPNFNPGKQRGMPVRVRMVVPINFRLE